MPSRLLALKRTTRPTILSPIILFIDCVQPGGHSVFFLGKPLYRTGDRELTCRELHEIGLSAGVVRWGRSLADLSVHT